MTTVFIRIILLMFICTTNGSSCPVTVTSECRCQQLTPSLVNVDCSFVSQSNITNTLIQDISSDLPPIKINVLNITGSHLTSLPSNFLQRVGSINHVDLSHNLFSDLPLCLQSVENITLIDISYNQVKMINLTELHTQSLDISHNVISEIHICDVFRKQMNFLKCSYNNIKEIQQNLWTVAENLDLSFNLITHLPSATISSIKTLNLKGNSLQKIENNWFLGFKNLMVLDISQNLIRYLTNKTFSGLSALTELQLSQNHLSDLHNSVFKHSSFLRNLSLNENKIQDLRESTFKGLEECLEQLSINQNEIEQIDDNTFINLRNLRNLDLSDNVKIKTIEHINFPPHMIILNLSNCNLHQISDCKFFDSVDLEHLVLNDNNLTCSCHLSWLYIKYESRHQNSQQPFGNTWTCHAADNIFKPVMGDLSSCLGDSFTEHHCKSPIPQAIKPDDILLTLFLSSEDDKILTTWEITPDNALEFTDGFKVFYLADGEILFESPLLNKSKRLFVINKEEEHSDYTVCVHILQNATKTLKKTCNSVIKKGLQVIVGILAGIVFLIPCIIALTYILFKDKQMMALYDPIKTDIDYNSVNYNGNVKNNTVVKDKPGDIQKPTKCHKKQPSGDDFMCVHASVSVYSEIQEVKKPDTQEVQKPDTQEVKKPETQEVKKPDTQEVKMPDTEEVKKLDTQEVKKPDTQEVTMPDTQEVKMPDKTISSAGCSQTNKGYSSDCEVSIQIESQLDNMKEIVVDNTRQINIKL